MQDRTEEAMRAEAAALAASHPDIRDGNSPTVPAVIVTVPANATGCQIAVRHMPYGIDVDYREQPDHAWAPIHFFGGSVEVRENAPPLLACEEDDEPRDIGRTDDDYPQALTIVRGGAA